MDKIDEMKRELDEATDQIEILQALGLLNGGTWSSDLEAIRPMLTHILYKVVNNKIVTLKDYALLAYQLNKTDGE